MLVGFNNNFIYMV